MPDPRLRRLPDGPARMLAAAALLLPLAGCRALRTDQYLLVWLLVPLLAFLGAGGLYVFTRRSRQLAGWDLKRQPEAPGVAAILTQVLWTAGAAFVVFTAYNLYLKRMDLSLKLENIALWLLGTLIGVYAAAYLGLHLAERGLPRDRAGRVAVRTRRQ